MTRTRRARWLLWPAAIVAALVVLAIVGPRLVPTEALRARAVEAVAAATGADVGLDQATVVVLPRPALVLRGGFIRGTGAALLAARGDAWGIDSYRAQVGRAEIRVALLPLLRRRLEVRDVTVTLPRLEVVRDGRMAVAAEDLRLSLRDLIPGGAGRGPAAGAASPPGLLLPEDAGCRVDLAAGQLELAGAAWAGVSLAAALDRRVVEVTRAEAGLGGGRVSAAGTVDFARDPWGDLAFEATATGVPAAALLGPWLPDLGRRLETQLTVRASGSCGLRDAATVRRTLDVTGTADGGEGVLRARDWLRDVAPYLGARQDLRDIRFTRLRHEFRIAQERYHVQDLELTGGDTDWTAEGEVGLDGTLDLAVEVKLPPGFTPDLGSWSFLAGTLRDADGRVTLDLRVGGRTDRPTVGLDLSNLQADKVKKGVGRLLDKWKSR